MSIQGVSSIYFRIIPEARSGLELYYVLLSILGKDMRRLHVFRTYSGAYDAQLFRHGM